jgi:sporulation protein YlmC with PRC-barrel domain
LIVLNAPGDYVGTLMNLRLNIRQLQKRGRRDVIPLSKKFLIYFQMKLKQAIKKYPNGVIYYHDNGAWCFYSKPIPDIEEEEIENYLVEVDEAQDWLDEGYAPAIVIALADMLHIKVESV